MNNLLPFVDLNYQLKKKKGIPFWNWRNCKIYHFILLFKKY